MNGPHECVAHNDWLVLSCGSPYVMGGSGKQEDSVRLPFFFLLYYGFGLKKIVLY